MPGKRVQFDDDTWEAIEAVTHDSGESFQELADEAVQGSAREAQTASRAEGGARGERGASQRPKLPRSVRKE